MELKNVAAFSLGAVMGLLVLPSRLDAVGLAYPPKHRAPTPGVIPISLRIATGDTFSPQDDTSDLATPPSESFSPYAKLLASMRGLTESSMSLVAKMQEIDLDETAGMCDRDRLRQIVALEAEHGAYRLAVFDLVTALSDLTEMDAEEPAQERAVPLFAVDRRRDPRDEMQAGMTMVLEAVAELAKTQAALQPSDVAAAIERVAKGYGIYHAGYEALNRAMSSEGADETPTHRRLPPPLLGI